MKVSANANTEILDAAKALSNAESNLRNYTENLRNVRDQEFLAKGGCKTCHGYGVILTWSTLDGSGYDERGSCPEANCTAKATGPCVTKSYPSSGGGHVDVSAFAQSPAEKQMWENHTNNVKMCEENLNVMKDKWTPSKGKEVEVIRGSKGASKGQKGVVFWTGESTYSTGYNTTRTLKVGFKTLEGVTCWTTENSCVVVNTEVKEDPFKLVVGKVKKETRRAILLVVNGKEIWIPRSQVTKLNDVGFKVPKWLAEKNGL